MDAGVSTGLLLEAEVMRGSLDVAERCENFRGMGAMQGEYEGVEFKGIGGASLKVTGSFSLGVKELVCKELEAFFLDSPEGVESANRSTGEWLGYCSKLECWSVLIDVALHEGLDRSRTPSAGRYIATDCKVLFSFFALLDVSVQVLTNGEEITSLFS